MMSLSRPAALLATLLALPGLPAFGLEDTTPMTGAEFERYTTGKTLTFAVGGVPYGVEQYLPGRRVVWAFLGEACRDGSWFDAGPQICFVYDDEPGRLHCWEFHRTDDGLVARIDGGSELVEVDQSDQPMFCPGPDVGA